jgi:hypothetical protein
MKEAIKAKHLSNKGHLQMVQREEVKEVPVDRVLAICSTSPDRVAERFHNRGVRRLDTTTEATCR